MAVTGKQDASNVISAKPASVVGGVFTCSIADAARISEHVDLANPPSGVNLEAVGYITEDGVTRSVSNDTSAIKAWGGDVILTTTEGAEATLEVPVAEYLNPVGHKLLYGASNVTVTPATATEGTKIHISAKLNELSPHVGIVLVIASDAAKGTIVYPDAQATLDGDLEMNGTDVTTLPLTFNLRPVNGEFYREYWVRGDATGSGS